MKQKIQLSCLFAVAALLQGCAGYNTVMFMTKSTAGLDIDTKPPTAEINISRKEAVIAPAFEKGQTPPVLASFKPNVGFGNRFGNYFLGVDQTFAGGDAAKTMAILYADPTCKYDDPKFNSELQLDTPIASSGVWWKDIFTAPAEPGKIKPFIFGTDTMLGLKVAWSGVGGQFPDTVKLGFNRKEFAWAPVTMSGDKKKVKMPSFLATIESNIGVGSETAEPSGTSTSGQNQQGGIKSIQYFATGEAASHLARQKDVRDAMLKRLDPRFGESLQIGKGPVARQMLGAMDLAFFQLQGVDDIANAHFQKLQDLKGVQVPFSFESDKKPIFLYKETEDPFVFKKDTEMDIRGTSTITLSNVTSYMANLERSKSALKSIKDQLDKNNTVSLSVDDGPPTPILSNTEIDEQLVIQDNELRRIEQEVAADRDITAAFDYFRNLTQR